MFLSIYSKVSSLCHPSKSETLKNLQGPIRSQFPLFLTSKLLCLLGFFISQEHSRHSHPSKPFFLLLFPMLDFLDNNRAHSLHSFTFWSTVTSQDWLSQVTIFKIVTITSTFLISLLWVVFPYTTQITIWHITHFHTF